jgi:methylmalonyl-CoA/ethylmalonyl-CoA epimerase
VQTDLLHERSQLDHIAIAVKNLDEAVAFYEGVLGLKCGGRERVADQLVDVAFFGEGPGRIELICPFTPDSGVAKFLEKRGEGLHHLCINVPDLMGALAAFTARGLPLLDQQPRVGAGGSQIAFAHPRGTKGVLLELKQRGTGHGAGEGAGSNPAVPLNRTP